MKHRVLFFLFFLLLTARSVAQDGSLDTTYGGIRSKFKTLAISTVSALVAAGSNKFVTVSYDFNNVGTSLAVLSRFNTDGTLDQTFGTNGRNIMQFTNDGAPKGADVRTDAKIAVTGYQFDGTDNDVYVAQYNSNGTLDTSFSGDGVMTISTGADAEGNIVRINSNNGSMIVAGIHNNHAALFRVTVGGNLSTSFGTAGMVSTNFLNGSESHFDAMLLTNGASKILAAGSGYDSAGSGTSGFITRYSYEGVKETAFGTGGVTTFKLPGGNNTAIVSLQVLSGGRILALAVDDTPQDIITVVRFTPDGIIDSTYGTNGIATIASGADVQGTSLALQSDGRLLVAGATGNNAVIYRLDTTGVLDNSFGSNGIRSDQIDGAQTAWNHVRVLSNGTIAAGGFVFDGGVYLSAYANFSSNGTPVRAGFTVKQEGTQNTEWHAVALQDDGKSVVTGNSYINGAYRIVTERLTSDGLSDYSFADSGLVSTAVGGDDYGKAVAIQDDGKIVVAAKVAGAGESDFAVIRYNSDGTLDGSFGTGGIDTADIGGDDSPEAIAIQPDGKIVVAGYSVISGANVFSLARFDSSGTLDTGFGVNGKVTTQIPVVTGGVVTSLMLPGDGKIIAAGYGGTGLHYFSIVRYNSNGSIDSSFGPSGNGTVSSSFSLSSAGASAALLADGKILIGGTYTSDFTVVRYSSSGIIDSTFGTNGVAQIGVGNIDLLKSIAVQTDGKIFAAGSTWNGSQNVFAFARLNSGGTPDASFGTSGSTLLDIDDIDATTSAVIQPDDKIIVSGYVTNLGRKIGTILRLNATSTPLPVELSSFTAVVKGNSIELFWRTETELNNYGYEVERKQIPLNPPLQGGSRIRTADEAGRFEKVGFVHGNGTTNSPKIYSFTDAAAQGKVVYRLKQIDNDGKFEYSSEVEVTVGQTPKAFALEQNYPNPFNPTTEIRYQMSEISNVTLKVFDVIGREVATLVNEVKEAGSYSVTFNASNLASGMYFARLQSNGKQMMKKMLLVK